MKTYKYDEASVKALQEWAKNTEFPQKLRLSKAEEIFDVPRYVQANLFDIEEHGSDPFYRPSITRLYRLKELIENPL